MDKLKTDINGGFPFDLNDIRWEQAGIADAFKAIAKIFGDNFIISGLELVLNNGTEYDWTEGYCVLDGEVCKVDASTAPIDIVALPYIYLEIDESYDPDGLEVFENNVQHDTYLKRRVKLVGYNSAQSGVLLSTTKRAEQLINDMTEGYEHSYTKKQGWNFAGDIVTPNSSVISVTPSDGNLWRVNIDAVVVEKDRITTGLGNGTWFMLSFTTTNGNVVKLKDGGATSGRIRTPNARTYIFEDGQTALFVVMDGMYYLVNQPTNAIQVDGVAKLRTKVIEIGDWDMDATAAISVAHLLADSQKIRAISVMVRENAPGVKLYNLENPSTAGTEVYGAIAFITSTHVTLSRATSGFFDSLAFDSTSFNRGWITITYEE